MTTTSDLRARIEQLEGEAKEASNRYLRLAADFDNYKKRARQEQTDLVFEGKTESVEGRKIFVTGTLHAGGTLTAEAEGVFVNLLQPRAVEYFDPERPALG